MRKVACFPNILQSFMLSQISFNLSPTTVSSTQRVVQKNSENLSTLVTDIKSFLRAGVSCKIVYTALNIDFIPSHFSLLQIWILRALYVNYTIHYLKTSFLFLFFLIFLNKFKQFTIRWWSIHRNLCYFISKIYGVDNFIKGC